MKKRKVVYFAIILILVPFFYFLLNLFSEKELTETCVEDKDCVPSSCCHAESCVNIDNFKNCSGIYCTQECSGPLDCRCVQEKCQVIKNE